jgi:hypothetical protein
MLEVVIDRERWLRGEGSTQSFLLRPEDGRMCCIGFACLAADLKPEDIMGRKTLAQATTSAVARSAPGTPLASLFPRIVLERLYGANDILSPFAGGDEHREAEIIRLGLLADIAFSFIN